jgi:predicted anti-sigma-YlaC factor YlaD
MMECRETAELLGAYLALELERPRELAVRAHLEGCGACRAALAAAEPGAALALALGAVSVPEDPEFAAGVLAGIRQRRVEGRLAHLRRRVLTAAAALLVAVLGGWALLGRRPAAPPAAVAARAEAAPAAVEPAFLEVEGEGIRFYELVADAPVGSAQGAVKVAFIVDPRLEL